jgi:hypothetical protein
MAVSMSYVLEQGPVLAGLARTAVSALRQRGGAGPSKTFSVPGAELHAVLPPRSPELVAAYVRNVGGDPSAYRTVLPPHLFPQWSFGLAARTLEGAPYPLLQVMNGGCKMEVRAPLPQGVPLHVRVRLAGVDDNGQRAILDQEIITGTDKEPDALVCHLYAYVPLGKGKASDGAAGAKASPRPAKKDRARVPVDARELAFWRIPATAGLDFAKLTGDFNPVHWVPAYARAMGFRSTILHGFGTLARAYEGLGKTVYAGSARSITGVDVRFTRPLVLPARVGLYLAPEHRIFVGDAPGGGAYLEGTYTSRS